MGARGIGSSHCGKCGLRIIEHTVGWEHMNTAAGRRADKDHQPRPAKPKQKETR